MRIWRYYGNFLSMEQNDVIHKGFVLAGYKHTGEIL